MSLFPTYYKKRLYRYKIKKKNNGHKYYKPVHKSEFSAEELDVIYDERGVGGEPVEYRW